MATLEFQDFEFIDQEDNIRVNFLKIFYFTIKKTDLQTIADYTIDKNKITFKDLSEKSASNKFNILISQGFNNLKNSLNNHNTIYIHQNSGIPLIGSRSFGIIDRGSDMIEIKPLTSCNINCIYCSVDEGTSTKKVVDYIIEKDYLVEETRKLIGHKKEKIDIYINPQGEPLLYADIVELVKDLKDLTQIDEIHIITNGLLLTKELIDHLADAGLTHLNISISAMEEKKAKILAGTAKYDITHITDMIDYAIKKTEVIITPVYLPTMNEEELEKIIEFARPRKIKVMVQNFLENKRGRNPVRQKTWEEFFDLMKRLEKKHDFKLLTSKEELRLTKTEELPIPFKRNDVIKADIVAPGRYPKESLAVAGERSITVLNHVFERPKTLKIKIIQANHNLITAKVCE